MDKEKFAQSYVEKLQLENNLKIDNKSKYIWIKEIVSYFGSFNSIGRRILKAYPNMNRDELALAIAKKLYSRTKYNPIKAIILKKVVKEIENRIINKSAREN
ncbi:hypothetical protein [Staphylococcus petrasii]|uniref:hypothetical protein n=1 Tax=Staphylococcus petrasii TaxID=1276936 RepID=UPI000CD22762|nr:hypothetical protein [Staphylococcus petrasii]PNZ80434.1 hypothetical protein CD127_10295 [Staphylococcus petrasii]TGA81381.1 hypothetical protein E2554_07660 [Staphylococcus petrasii]SUM58849.1 Uncharacterised protein [Staphylococcus petrasii]